VLLGLAAGGASAAARRATSGLDLMPLPGSSLGPLAQSLTLDPDSGEVTNVQAAKNATRPVTASALSSLGRETGYRLDYHDPTGAALASGHGLLRVNTQVDQYRSASSTSAGLAFIRSDALSAASLSSSLLSVHVVQFSPGKLGQESFGVMGTVTPKGEKAGYDAQVAFRTGAYVALVAVSAADPAGLQSLAVSLARKLQARVAGVLGGKVSGAPVALPAKLKAGPPPHGPNLEKMALTPSDVGSGRVEHQGYQVDSNLEPVSEYDRHMSPGGTFAILDSEVAMFHSPTEASYTEGFAIGGFGSPTEVKWVFGQSIAGVKITSVTSKEIAVHGGDEAKAVVVTIRLADGERVDVAFAGVRRGSVVDLLTVFAPIGRAVSASSLQNLVSIAATRLRGGHTGNVA
jgi:hypothetical protein